MKVSLNDTTTKRVIELLAAFPEGTKLTHVINVALNELYSKTIPNTAEKTYDTSRKEHQT